MANTWIKKHLAILLPCFFVFTTAPQAQSEVNILESKIEQAYSNGELDGLHAVLVQRRGKIIAENYFSGSDESWGTELGHRSFDASSLHDIRSVTKSITSLLYGIALSEGKVPHLEKSIVDQFPQYPDLIEDADRQKINIRHVLSMMMGTDWNENVPYTSTANSEVAMEMAPDRYRFILDRPIVKLAGKVWNYNGGATALIGYLIQHGTGKPLNAFATEKLFEPLGIKNTEWIKGSDGVPSAASGLRMTTHDLAKIGTVLVNQGKYNGNQIIPHKWIDQSFTPQGGNAEGLQYGYFWWLAPVGNPPRWATGFGNGGQRLYVNPKAGLVIVIFAGNYNSREGGMRSAKIIRDIIIPALFDD